MKRELDEFTAQAAPALADSYNNLGAIAAGGNEFATATGYFEKAAKWNPALEGLDYNWGRAAFPVSGYAQAVLPIGRYLAAHPEEQGARRVLGVSYFMVKDYALRRGRRCGRLSRGSPRLRNWPRCMLSRWC